MSPEEFMPEVNFDNIEIGFTLGCGVDLAPKPSSNISLSF